VIQQSTNTHNPAILAYGEEGLAHGSNNVTFTGNTVVNDSGGYGVLNPTGAGLTSFVGNDVFNLANPLGGTVLATRPILDLSPIGFLGSSTPSPPPPSPPPAEPPPPSLPPPTPLPDPSPTLSLLEQYHADVLADFVAWAMLNPKLSTKPQTLKVFSKEMNSTTVLGVLPGDHWSN
jgi:hypothetical protein